MQAWWRSRGYKDVMTPDRTRQSEQDMMAALPLKRIDVRGVESLSANSGAFGRADSRPGVYVLHFGDGSEYVGQCRVSRSHAGASTGWWCSCRQA